MSKIDPPEWRDSKARTAVERWVTLQQGSAEAPAGSEQDPMPSDMFYEHRTPTHVWVRASNERPDEDSCTASSHHPVSWLFVRNSVVSSQFQVIVGQLFLGGTLRSHATALLL